MSAEPSKGEVFAPFRTVEILPQDRIQSCKLPQTLRADRLEKVENAAGINVTGYVV